MSFPEKQKCTINFMRDILLETNKGKLLLELDYNDLNLKELVARCKSKLADIKIKNSYILRYNNEISEIKKILERDDKRAALGLLEDKLLPESFKKWLAEKQKLNHSISDDAEVECLLDFGEYVGINK